MQNLAKYLYLLSAGLILLSCNQRSSSKKEIDKIKIENHGVAIDYTDSKVGDTTLFFIHGWGINKTYWTNQVAYFSKRYRVVTIDLPGFGKSGKNRKAWTAEEYCSDVLNIIKTLHLKNVILVGHSMSGAIIVETASTNPQKIIGIIGVDNLKNIGFVMTPETEKEWSNYYTNARKDFKKTISNDIQQLFSSTTYFSIQQRVKNDILNSDTNIAVDVLENLDKYIFTKKLETLHKKIYLINSDYIPTDTTFFVQNKIRYCLLNIGNTGHYPMLEKSNEFNSALENAINKIENETK